jgi:lipid A 3-O-deacylase
MKMMPKQLFRKIAVLSVMAGPKLMADPQTSADNSFSIDDNFRFGWHEVSAGSSVYFTSVVRRFDHPEMNYAGGFLQTAYTLTSPDGDGPLRGSFQLALEAFGSGVYRGYGSYVAGGTLWCRYNFVQPGWRLVPFVEGGAGLTSMDIPHRYDGKDFNFNLELGGGARFFVTEHWSLNAEYRFQHISNADIWYRNVGVNTLGVTTGVSFYF